MLGQVDAAVLRTAQRVSQSSGEPDERSASGVFADRLDDISGSSDGCDWSIRTEVPPQRWETGSRDRRAGGFDLFVGVDVSLRDRTPINVQKGLLLQAKRLTSLLEDRRSRASLRREAVALVNLSATAGGVLLYSTDDVRVATAGAIRRWIPRDGGSSSDAQTLWNDGRSVRSLISRTINCSAGDPTAPTWEDVVRRIERVPRVALAISARSTP